MSRFSRSDKVEGIFEPIIRTIEYSGNLTSGEVFYQGLCGLDTDSIAFTFHHWRENGKVYQEGDIRAIVFPGAHICLGRFKEGFRPKISVYIGKACGIHTADAQLRVDPSGYMNMWVQPNNPKYWSIETAGSLSSSAQLSGYSGKPNTTPWEDGQTRISTYYAASGAEKEATISLQQTTIPLDLIGFRCNCCWDVEY